MKRRPNICNIRKYPADFEALSANENRPVRRLNVLNVLAIIAGWTMFFGTLLNAFGVF